MIIDRTPTGNPLFDSDGDLHGEDWSANGRQRRDPARRQGQGREAKRCAVTPQPNVTTTEVSLCLDRDPVRGGSRHDSRFGGSVRLAGMQVERGILEHSGSNGNAETSLRVDRKNHWIHVYSGGDVTVKRCTANAVAAVLLRMTDHTRFAARTANCTKDCGDITGTCARRYSAAHPRDRSPTHNLWERLKKHEPAVLTPGTNNRSATFE